MKDIMYRNIFRIHCQEFALCLPLWLGWSCMSFSLTLRTGCIEGRTAGRRERAGLSRSWGKNLRSLRFHVAVISKKTSADWCFGTWFLWLSHHIGNFIIPTDELIFFRGVGWNHQPVSYFHEPNDVSISKQWEMCLAHSHPHPSGAEAKIQKAKSKASAGEGNSMRSITGFRDILRYFGIFWDILQDLGDILGICWVKH